jgi:2-polyprenyl-3-methyl-5-hydroxy-6-metoxy-1,4-benzoquinol methylase
MPTLSAGPSAVDVDGAELAALLAAADPTGLRVLEVGCGEGRLTRRYAGRAASVLAIDTDATRIAAARAAIADPHIRFETATLEELDVPPGFDLTFFSWSL